MSAEDHRSKDEILRAAKSKQAARPATKQPSEKGERRDQGQGDEPPLDKWAAYRAGKGLSSDPPKKQETPKKPEEPDGGDNHPEANDDDKGKKRKKKKKDRTPSPPSSDSGSSSNDTSDSDDESSSSDMRRKKKKDRKDKGEKVKGCDDIKIEKLPHMGDFDDWVYEQRQKMMTACKANPDHTLRFVLQVENAARNGRDCPE
eukprot:4316718-Amphidinium_carterae.1